MAGRRPGPPTHVEPRRDAAAPAARGAGEGRARARARGAPIRSQTTAPIVPAGSVTGRSLTLVITIMCFLACLTAGAVYMMNQSASAWLRDIASEVTVQIEAKERADIDKLVADVSGFLSRAARHRHRARAQRCRRGRSCSSRGSARPMRCKRCRCRA